MNHSFNIEVAKKYGIVPAILLENLYWWVEKNTANGRHYFDGHNWTYNSAKAFERQFPYLTRRQIGYALKSLEDNGLIITGDYNENRCLRTKWYAITKEGYSILQNCQMQITNLSNASTGIYIINTSSCTDINETDINTPINAPTENDKTASDDAAPAAPKGGVSETVKQAVLPEVGNGRQTYNRKTERGLHLRRFQDSHRQEGNRLERRRAHGTVPTTGDTDRLQVRRISERGDGTEVIQGGKERDLRLRRVGTDS